MSMKFKVHDLICNDIAVRMVHGIAIVDLHKCQYHSIPCKTTVYCLSSSSNHNWVNTEWCEENMVENNKYRKMIVKDKNKDFVKYEPYTTEIPGEEVFTHLYTLKLLGDKWFIGLTSNVHDSVENHKSGAAAAFTRTYPVIGLEEEMKFDTPKPEHEAVVIANKKIMELWDKYGFENVKCSWSR